MADQTSVTWSAHLRTLCLKYRLLDPLQLLQSGQVWKMQKWAELTRTQVTVHRETELREKSKSNSKMKYLNVQIQGFSGIPHPVLLNISNTQDIMRLRHHIKIFAGDFLTAERLAADNGSDHKCKLRHAQVEDLDHVLTQCRASTDIRERILPELLNTVLQAQPDCSILLCPVQAQHLTQFILDCTSLNLPSSCRVVVHNPAAGRVFHVARNWCFGISRARARLLQTNKT